MNSVGLALGGAAALFLVGCNTVVVEDPRPLPPVVVGPGPGPYPIPGPPPPPAGCYAEDADWAIGQPATAAVVERATYDSGARSARVLRPGEFYTQDYRPDRLNIVLDQWGRIADLRCG